MTTCEHASAGDAAAQASSRIGALAPETASRWHALQSTLAVIARQYPDAAFATSLGAEDMVLTHAIYTADLPITIFTLDTGRLPQATHQTIEAVASRYGRSMMVCHPDARQVAEHVQAHGAFAFYDSVDLRKACCDIRKVQPLRRVLAGRGAWLTGQRREQASTRGALPEHEQDSVFGLYKFNPLALWTQADVWRVIDFFGVPYNPLHDQGYPSIGCDPCTRAVREGEDLRAGRWWWEAVDAKECGLHAGNPRPVRAIHPVR